LFDLGLYEIKDIFFADGAVSDNMQLTEFMYNRAMNFKQYKDDLQDFKSVSRSAFYEREYLVNLLKYDMKEMPNSVTKMTNTRFYEYLIIPVRWREGKDGAVNIQSGQLLEFYYYLSKGVEMDILDNSEETQSRVRNNLQLMNDNFPELKRINHENLYLYKDMSDRSLNLINLLIYVLGVGHALLSAMIFCLFKREKVFRRKQQVEGYSIYKLIPRKVI